MIACWEPQSMGEVQVQVDRHVGIVEIQRPPNNHLSHQVVSDLVDAFRSLSEDGCRVAVLCSAGRNFCAGADLQTRDLFMGDAMARFYELASQLFDVPIPIVAGVQGNAVGGGLGLALAADFRVCSPSSRFTANFSRLGFHQGFGLSVALPLVVGHQRAIDMLYTGRRVSGEEAAAIGLSDKVVPDEQLRDSTIELAREIGASAPLAVRSIKKTMRGHLGDAVRQVLLRERAEQDRLQKTHDWVEGVEAAAGRREPTFSGR
jgi:2-(1,2-epoxy-1,2-dihydrophenyl)acetyl-CoA isomerase